MSRHTESEPTQIPPGPLLASRPEQLGQVVGRCQGCTTLGPLVRSVSAVLASYARAVYTWSERSDGESVEALDYVLTHAPWVGFAVLFSLVVLFSWIDRDVDDSAIPIATWGFCALGSLIGLSARGVPIDVAGQVGSYVYFGALIGSGFRPGLLTQLSRRDEERGWLHYGNLYFLTGWTGVAYVGVWGVFPLLEPYL